MGLRFNVARWAALLSAEVTSLLSLPPQQQYAPLCHAARDDGCVLDARSSGGGLSRPNICSGWVEIDIEMQMGSLHASFGLRLRHRDGGEDTQIARGRERVGLSMSCNDVFFCFQMVVDGAKIMLAVRLSTINYIGGAKQTVRTRYWGIVRVSCRVRY